MDRLKAAGVLLTVSGALMVVALLLDWWGYPSAFDQPADLPDAAAFLAEGVRDSGREPDADAFEFFDFRDLVWLGAGLAAFVFGLMVLAASRVAIVAAAIVGALALFATLLVAVSLASPPDYADLVPEAAKPIDFGVDLPLSPEVGGFVALAAALGMLAGAGLAFRSLRNGSHTTPR